MSISVFSAQIANPIPRITAQGITVWEAHIGSTWQRKKCHCKGDSGDSKVVKMIWFIYQEWHKERFLLTLNCHKRPRKSHHDTGDEEIIECCSWKRNKWWGSSWWIPVPDSNNARDPRHFTLYLCHRACLHSWQQNCEKINSGEKKEEMESAPEGLGSWSTRCRDSVGLNHSFPTPRQTIVTYDADNRVVERCSGPVYLNIYCAIDKSSTRNVLKWGTFQEMKANIKQHLIINSSVTPILSQKCKILKPHDGIEPTTWNVYQLRRCFLYQPYYYWGWSFNKNMEF